MKLFWSMLVTLAILSVGVAQTGTPPKAGALSPAVTAVNLGNLEDGQYVLTIKGGRPEGLAPLYLLSFGDGPTQPPPPPPPPPEPSELEKIVQDTTANLPQAQKVNVAAEFIALAVLVKAGIVKPADVPAKTVESVKSATGDSFSDWESFGSGVNGWLRANSVDTGDEIVRAYQTIAKVLSGNSAIDWNVIVPVILKILKGEKIDWPTLIPIIIEVVKNVVGG